MGCSSCGETTQAKCDCCELVDGDTSFKLVTYCEDCKAYICDKCKNNWAKRIIAYLKRKFG